MRYVVIIAGGSGKRLWPLSRHGTPKQLLKVIGGKSLLRIAFERLDGLVPASRVLVCTGADYADVVAAELPELDAENILGEPEGRDSLNAVAWPAAVLTGRDPEAVMAVVTADHLMDPVESFRAAVDEGFAMAESNPAPLVTFGVVPTSAHTGYGYLQHGEAVPGHPTVNRVLAFREKPDAETAEQYLWNGGYWWNSGMFVWRARTFLDQLEVLLPVSHAALRELAEKPEHLSEIYPQLQRISVDYAILEPVSHGLGSAQVVAVRLPISWHDVGGFAALKEQLPHDTERNATSGVVVTHDAHDNLVLNHGEDGRLLAVLGLSETVVVQTPQITLVCPISESERVKELLAEVTEQLGATYA